MELSIIIVNYNVKHFLEQCLYSVQAAIEGLRAEVIVVDNHSTDQSLAYLQPDFPAVKFIANNENLGFAKACNQGLSVSTGDYVLFLNPDTIVPTDCFKKCIQFFERTPDAGAIGIRMIDGSGEFLKESKRAFPSPMTSLYKLSGLARLFPKSKTFSRYHLGYLDPDQNNEVDVLAGAFMMLRRAVIDKVKGFDEIFFMYGEDVDLSYRVQEAGYKNYYFAESSIIHFKGESTRKGSMNYVRMFYNAMSIFVRKHYGGSRAGIFNLLIHLAIWIRAALTTVGQFIRRIGLPLIDAGLILLSFWVMKNFWNQYVRTDIQYENRLLWIVFPIFTVIYLVIAYYAGLYDRWYKRTELIRSTLIATIVLLAGYSLLPEHYRFSRGIILFGALLAFILISLLRWILIELRVLSSNKVREEHFTTVIAATASEYEEVIKLLKNANMHHRILGRAAVEDQDDRSLGSWKNLSKLSRTVPFKEIIYCQGSASFSEIIDSIQQLPAGVRAKIHAKGSHSIVGSDSKDSSGESLSKENGFLLSDPYNRRIKRLIDVSYAFLCILFFPLHFIFNKHPLRFLSNCFKVLFAQKTWIGYLSHAKHLPPLHHGVLASNGIPLSQPQSLPAESLYMLDYWYARDYEPGADLRMIFKNYSRLGQ